MNLYTRDLSPTTYILYPPHSGDLVIGPTDIAYLPAQEQLSLEQTVRAALTSRGIGASGYPQIARFDVWEWTDPNWGKRWCRAIGGSLRNQNQNLCERRQPIPLLAEWSSVKFTTCRVWCPKRNLYSSLYFFIAAIRLNNISIPMTVTNGLMLCAARLWLWTLTAAWHLLKVRRRTAQCVFQVLAWQLSSVRGLEQSKLNFYLSSWSGMAIYEITSILSLSHTISLYASIQYHIHVYI